MGTSGGTAQQSTGISPQTAPAPMTFPGPTVPARCPGCGRCGTCGRPYPAPYNPWPWYGHNWTPANGVGYIQVAFNA